MTNANRRLNTWLIVLLGIGLWALSDSSWAACLVKPRQLDGLGTVYTLMLAPESEVGQYVSLGFSRVECPTDLSIVRGYVQRLCDGTGRGFLRSLNTEALIGRPRALACASARAGLAEAGG